MDLGGCWRAAPAADELRRLLPDPDYDDRTWEQVPVPGQWRSQPVFADADGPIFYRHRFATQPLEAGRRAWLRFDGLFYQSDVWLDGSYLGDTEGYFAPQVFEVTDHLRQRDEHLLAVELSCDRQADLRRKRNLTGVFQHFDAIDPAWNPGGIWAPVAITTSGPVHLTTLRVLCREATTERATLDIEATLDADEARAVTLRATVGRHVDEGGTAVRPTDGGGGTGRGGPAPAPDAGSSEEHKLAAGPNRVRWRLTVERPALWWPRALGERPLHDLTLDVVVDGRSSDRQVVTTGLRQIRMQRFVARVNGERLFLKGANLGPTRRAMAEATPDDVRRDVALACDAGLDLLRVHAHIARPELYAAADRTGLLLWQDLPLQWGYGQVRRQAVRQARRAVDLLGHHPAIALWCGHDEPDRTGPLDGDGTATRRRTRAALSQKVAQTLPSWNRTGLDRSVRRALERADPSRPVVAHAGVAPHPAGATDTHLRLGWEHGDERDLPKAMARWPVLARFVGSFGPPALPATASFMGPARWPDLDWDELERANGLDRATFERRVPPGDHATFDGWRDATQRYQAEVVRHHVETLRRLKYRPTGGFCHALLADAQPAVSRALLDHERVAKPAYGALLAAAAPVIVVADRLATEYPAGATIELDVHAVSDLRRPLPEIEATAVLSWPGGSRRFRWSGGIPADACVRIGEVIATVPNDAPAGPLRLDLTLSWGGGEAPSWAAGEAPSWAGEALPAGPRSVTNHYESRICAAPPRASTPSR
jgi:beta-mannosidase